jgi:hypothetical protein
MVVLCGLSMRGRWDGHKILMKSEGSGAHSNGVQGAIQNAFIIFIIFIIFVIFVM